MGVISFHRKRKDWANQVCQIIYSGLHVHLLTGFVKFVLPHIVTSAAAQFAALVPPKPGTTKCIGSTLAPLALAGLGFIVLASPRVLVLGFHQGARHSPVHLVGDVLRYGIPLHDG